MANLMTLNDELIKTSINYNCKQCRFKLVGATKRAILWSHLPPCVESILSSDNSFLQKRSTSISMVLTLIEGSAALHRLAHLRINSELTVSLILLLGISKIFGVRNTLVNTFCDSETLTRVCIINKLERQ